MIVIDTKQKPNFKGVQLKPPTQAEFDKYIDIWNKKYNKYNHEAILDGVFKKWNSDTDVLCMYIRCIMLDKFYGTNIKYIDELVHHLLSIKDLHKRIHAGDLDVIDEMQKVKKPNGKYIHYRSFVSKYCRRYNPQAYPIYDSIVKEVLEYYVNTTKFYTGKQPIDWKNYKVFKDVVDQFIKAYPFVKNYIMLDRYLWTMGKEKIEGIRLYNQIQTAKNTTDPVKQAKKLDEIRNKLNMPNATVQDLEDAVENIYFYYLNRRKPTRNPYEKH